MSNTLQWRAQLSAGDVVRAPFPDVAVAMIDPYNIAEVTAAVLTNDEHNGKTYRLSGPEPLRPADRVQVLAETLGRHLRFGAMTNTQAHAEMSAAMPRAYVDAFFDFYVNGSIDESTVLPTVRELTGHEPRTFAQWAATHRHAFSSPPA